MATTKRPDDEESRLKDDALTQASVMNDDDLTLGLPSMIFWGGVVFTSTFVLLLHWIVGIPFGLVYFLAMYRIHEDDPQALRGWINAALRRRVEAWSAGKHKGRKVYFFDIKE